MSDPVQARTLAESGGDNAGVAVVLAYLQWRDGCCADALSTLDAAGTQLRLDQGQRWLARALNIRGAVLSQLNQASEALTLFQEQLALAQQIADPEMIGMAHNDIGVLLIWDDPERALLRYQMAFEVFEGAGPDQTAGLGLAAFNLSVAHRELGDMVRSEAMLMRAEQLVLAARAWPYWVGVIGLRALDLAEAGELQAAREIFTEARTYLTVLPIASRQLLMFYQAKVELEGGEATRALELLGSLDSWRQTRQDMLDDYLYVYARAQAQAGNDHAAYELMTQAYRAVGTRHQLEHQVQLKALETVYRTRETQRLSESLQQHVQLLETLQEELRHISLTDELTGVNNRRRFLQWSESQLKRGFPLALAFIDIDHFKHVNDTAGHATGDQVIRHLGQLLQAHAGPDDLVARLGGDEFIMARIMTLPEGLDHHMEVFRASCEAQLLSTAGRPVTASIGVVVVRGDLSAGLRAADLAMYRAKQQGRNRVHR